MSSILYGNLQAEIVSNAVRASSGLVSGKRRLTCSAPANRGGAEAPDAWPGAGGG